MPTRFKISDNYLKNVLLFRANRDHGCLPLPGINAVGVSESELEVTGNSDSEVTEYFLISLTFDPR